MSDPTSWVNTVKLQGMFSSNRSISVESMKPRQTITQIILQMNMYAYYIYIEYDYIVYMYTHMICTYVYIYETVGD